MLASVHGFVANTDYEWFTFLRARGPLEEVNFWQPSGGDAFRALQPGEPFFFRLKRPHYAIGGFGYFARHEVVLAWLAWSSFGFGLTQEQLAQKLGVSFSTVNVWENAECAPLPFLRRYLLEMAEDAWRPSASKIASRRRRSGR